MVTAVLGPRETPGDMSHHRYSPSDPRPLFSVPKQSRSLPGKIVHWRMLGASVLSGLPSLLSRGRGRGLARQLFLHFLSRRFSSRTAAKWPVGPGR